MYHQFTSYHLGTNRAIFFMLPRPHIVQSEYTFVNGPRLLEGIQEVFLVVLRPKDLKGICVEAYLETAHVASEPIYKYETSTRPLTLYIYQEAIDESGSWGDDSKTVWKADTSEYAAEEGWEVDLDRNGGCTIDSVSGDRIESYQIQTIDRDHVVIWGQVTAWFEDGFWSNTSHNGWLSITATVYIRKKKPDIDGYNQNLFLTGRGTCCCEERLLEVKLPSIVWEGSELITGTSEKEEQVHGEVLLVQQPEDQKQSQRLSARKSEDPSIRSTVSKSTTKVVVGGSNALTTSQANKIRSEIGLQMLQSINHPNRYPRGKISFVDTQFVSRSIASIIRTDKHSDNQPISGIKGLDDTIRDRIVKLAPKASRGRLLQTSIDELIDRFGLDLKEAKKLRRALLGLEGALPEVQRRWDRPGQVLRTTAPLEQMVPQVTGIYSDEARKILKDKYFFVDNIVYKDNEMSRGIVLSQYPDAGTRSHAGAKIDLEISSGAVVCIPELVGKSLMQAFNMLREAGLESDPFVTLIPSEDGPWNRIIRAIPQMKTYVTPHASVFLSVSSKTEMISSIDLHDGLKYGEHCSQKVEEPTIVIEVPNLVGKPLSDASEIIKLSGLSLDDIVYEDNEQPFNTIINQYPNAKDKVATGSEIDLVLSSGLSVQIPDIVGIPLNEALGKLSGAGLKSQPEIMHTTSEKYPKNYVIEVTPEVGTYVAPHASVTLEVAGKLTKEQRSAEKK
jgi:beta-lactam-binding protein with PASTA domain